VSSYLLRGPREILDAIDRAAARQVQPGDQQIIQEAVNLLREPLWSEDNGSSSQERAVI
jgi:hypothetical protein